MGADRGGPRLRRRGLATPHPALHVLDSAASLFEKLTAGRSPRAVIALTDAGLSGTPGSDGALLVEAEAEAVGRAAAAAGVVLLELRPADTGGLEELFLSLTSTGREEALIS